MKISIDTDRCTGHGRCYATAPEVFDCDDEGYPILLVDQLGADDDRCAAATLARDNCPEDAISVTED